MKILITGGAGYIGSHTAVEILEAGHDIIIVDNLSNSSRESVRRISEITGKKIIFFEIDLRNREALEEVFEAHDIDAVIHFAALKAVGESVEKPLLYYHNNITGSLMLCEVMKKFHVKNIVFSSSATVYGDPASVPIGEDFPVATTNPYGTTKLVMETILRDLYISDNSWNVVILRYFNPIGAHESGRIGEDPNGIPNNLMPYISQVAVGKLKELSVFGNDYPTVDGTGVRDYVHVVDLAKGHLAALKKLFEKPGEVTYNLGTGHGISVLQMITAFEKVSEKKIPYKIVNRRPGDIAACWANPDKAEKELGWKAGKSLEDMCRDTWNWQSHNPEGYQGKENEKG
ncbi:MAG: UDP-glucose 4-epimerase GalE [Candidatus Marinimicrobia bacterium]|nr:UDP-glucose 4-epimerase GalE [Candidatus Neomarinimicrobiota bacterium]